LVEAKNGMSRLKTDGTQAVITGPGKSSFAKYQEIVVGKRGVYALLKHELLTGLFGSWPGASGIWFRRRLYPLLLRECGRNVTIGLNVTLRHPGRISLGNNVVLGDGCTLDAKGTDGEGIVVRDGVFIGTGTILSMADGTIEIDAGANIGSYCRIGTLGHTRIGRKVLLAAYCYIVGGGHETGNIEMPIIDQPNCTKGGAVVDDGSWLGARVTVMDGVHIGRHVIVGAHAVVTEDVPDYAVAVGIPARVTKMRK